MKKPNDIINKVPQEKRRRFLTFIVFLLFSTSLWLLIKLSKDYSTHSTFAINYRDVPVDKCITSDTTLVNFSFVADGFATLRHNLIHKSDRVINISLSEVPYHKENGSTYSFSSQYVAEKLALLLSVNTSNISMNEASILFDMEPLKAKKVAVALRSEIDTQRQYAIYGTPTLTPETITVYGPSQIIDTITMVYTQKLKKSGVSENINETIAIDCLNGQIKTDSANVKASIRIEKFTETSIEVPVSLSQKTGIRVLPETVAVKCMVPLCDFNNVNPDMIEIGIDEAQIGKDKILDLIVKKKPDNIEIKSIKPKQVEYLIVK